ncbi:MAG TPA: hypothetical protein VN408_41765 [Actinoplanes sp.]|nr:hypothetical protein [Actinoplanes sp.]
MGGRRRGGGVRWRTLRRFFDGPQPTRTVRAVDAGTDVYVLIPAPDGTAAEFNVEYFDGPGPRPELETRPAVLYGSPHDGAWCTIELDGHIYVPRAPVDEVDVVAYDRERGLPSWLDDDGEPAVDRDDLLPGDTDPATVSEFSPVSAGSWGRVLLSGLVGGFAGMSWPAATGDGMPDTVILTSAAAGLLIGLEVGWRQYLRPRIRWNTGGVSVVTPWRTHRLTWTADTGIEVDEDGRVSVTDGDTGFALAVRHGGSHDPDQLVAALRHARRTALDTRAPARPPLCRSRTGFGRIKGVNNTCQTITVGVALEE